MRLDFINNTVDCCGNVPINIIDSLTSETLFYLKDTIYALNKKQAGDMIYDNVNTSYQELLEDIQFLLMYLIRITERRALNEYNDLLYAPKDYFTDYNLQDIAAYFSCKGLNIQPVLDIWDLNLSELSSDTVGGISTMGIESTTNPFEII